MKKYRWIIVLALATATALVVAAGSTRPKSAQTKAQAAFNHAAVLEAVSPDAPTALTDIKQRSAANTAVTARALQVTEEQVGDVYSFGRPVRWIGVMNAAVSLQPSCVGVDPATCQVVVPSAALTYFDFPNIGKMTLPGNSTHSLMCHWLTPSFNFTFNNPSPFPGEAMLHVSHIITVENPVLNDPSLIDPTTGLPFGGQLEASVASSRLIRPIEGGQQLTERISDSRVCIAGLVNKGHLISTYGLTNVQATEFFKKPTTLRFRMVVRTVNLESATLYYGMRVVGD